ncbi:MAG: hypothetical protein QOF68_2212, partial [Gaiellales bacterium]|nr:hypothetical protein [Gaiellales bacterium]
RFEAWQEHGESAWRIDMGGRSSSRRRRRRRRRSAPRVESAPIAGRRTDSLTAAPAACPKCSARCVVADALGLHAVPVMGYVRIHSGDSGRAWLSGKMELSGFEPLTSSLLSVWAPLGSMRASASAFQGVGRWSLPTSSAKLQTSQRPNRPTDTEGSARLSRSPASGRRDLNSGPHRPERCALPGCATPRGRTP